MNRTRWLVCFLMVSTVGAALRGEEKAKPNFEVKSNLTYVKRDDLELKLDAYLPSGKGPFPAVMLVHGGGWRFGTRWQIGHHGVTLAKRGYVAFSITYRLAPRHKFPAQIDDCRDALRWIRRHAKQYKVDPKRVGGAGYSAGGHLVCLLAATGKKATAKTVDTRLQAVVAGGAPCEFRRLPPDSKSLTYWLGGTRRQKPEVYRMASPNAFASKSVPPTFFYHGMKDTLVPLDWMMPYYETIQKAGVTTELYRVKDAGHLTAFLSPECIQKACSFLDKHLKPTKPGAKPGASK